jgi:hypothetical protein
MKRLFPFSVLLVLALFAVACGSDSSSSASASEAAPQQVSRDGVSSLVDPGTVPAEQPAALTQPNVPTGPTTSINFKELEYDFGTVKDGEIARHEYAFTNTGTEPLIISNVKAGCGCTAPSWPKEPIPPGGNGKILVEFDSKGKPGPQSKGVTVYANTDPSQITLTIKGLVEAKG